MEGGKLANARCSTLDVTASTTPRRRGVTATNAWRRPTRRAARIAEVDEAGRFLG